jgi:hypothetical protein
MFDQTLADVRTRDLVSYTCSIERLIDSASRPAQSKLSVVVGRHRVRPRFEGNGCRLPQEIPMSTTMILDQVSYDAPMLVTRPVRRAPQGQVRLTRRGKVVVFALALLALLAIALLGAGMAGAASHGGEVATHDVTVAPGQTLWQLSSSAAHGGDVLSMEQRIKDLNGLDADGMLIAGQHLRIPN